MNDDHMITVVRASLVAARDSLTDVRMERPVESIAALAHGHRIRRGLVAVSASTAAALAVGTLAVTLSAGDRPAVTRPAGNHPALAAWTVTSTGTGTVRVTLRKLRDPAGLQRTLTRAGVPASVSFDSATCVPDQIGIIESNHGRFGGSVLRGDGVLLNVKGGEPPGPSALITIRPSLVPPGKLLQIKTFILTPRDDPGHPNWFVELGFLRIGTTPKCAR